MPSDLRRKNITAYRSHQVFFAVVILSCLGIPAIYHPLQAYSPQDVGESQLITMAVIDLEGKGISQVEASTLTDRLRTSLVQTGKVNVLERAMMEDILQETEFQQTGCVSTTSAILNGTVNPNNLSTTVTFVWGETTGYGNTIEADQSPITGTIDVAVSAILTGLSTNTKYQIKNQ